MQLRNKHVAFLGLMVALGLLFGYIESMFVLPVRIPGIRIGFSNIITVVTLYIMGPVNAFIVSIARVILSGVLFGNGISIIYALAGAIVSYTGMFVVYKINRFSAVGVSVIGGVLHNVGQIVAAMIITESVNVIYYIPVLIIVGTLAGCLVGIVSNILINRLVHLM